MSRDATAPTRSRKSIIENSEFTFTSQDLERIAEILRSESGIFLTEAKANLVYSRLAKRLRTLDLPDFAAYCDLLKQSDAHGEREEMIAALTTNVTRFFREPHHFEHLRQKVLPGLIAKARSGRRVRLWSAACSTGPEPYSIALTLLQEMPDVLRFDVKILATDIDRTVLATAQQGIYDQTLLEPVPPGQRTKWFNALNDGSGHLQAGEELRKLIEFKTLNLIGGWPLKKRFDVIFCRNVVIYFDNKTQEMIWSRFVPLMEPGASLYIGHSERVTGEAERLLLSDGITIYRKRLEGEGA